MTKTWRATLPILLASLLLFSSCSMGFTPATTKEKTAPDFQRRNLDGQLVALSDSRGKPVLVNFWATWCPPCREEMPYLQQVYDEWTAKGLVLLAVDIGETPAVVTKYFAENNLSMPVLFDSDEKVARKYNISGIPTTLLIDKDGIIRKTQIGAYPNKEAIEKDLNVIFR